MSTIYLTILLLIIWRDLMSRATDIRDRVQAEDAALKLVADSVVELDEKIEELHELVKNADIPEAQAAEINTALDGLAATRATLIERLAKVATDDEPTTPPTP